MRNGSKSSGGVKAKPRPARVEAGSGNVFADLGLPNPDLALVKAALVRRLRDAIRDRGLTQAQAARALGIDQPKVSALVRGRTDGYTLDRLFRLLTALGQQVEITVRPGAARGGVIVTDLG